MSGGDGKGHNSGAHSTGGVKGSSGKGGASSGKGGYDGHNLGGHTTDNGNGTSTTMDNRGSVTHYNGGSSGGGVHWGGGSGHGNGGGQGASHSGGVNLSLFPEAQASVAFGAPINISLIDNMWGLSVFRAQPVQDAVAAALTKLAQGVSTALPYAGRLAGVAFGLLVPSPIAPDDKKMMSRIVTMLPAEKVTKTPVASLPTQPAVVQVHTRIADLVQDEKQHLAVVGGKLMSVSVVDAKPTKRPGVFTISVVPGKPDIHVSVKNGKLAAFSQPKGITTAHGDVKPAGFTAGGNTYDAIIRFPPHSKTEPIYLSIVDVLTAEQVKKRQEDESRRQQEWDSIHPIEVAEREVDKAVKVLSQAQSRVNQKQAALVKLKNTAEGLALGDPKAHPIIATTAKSISVPSYSGGGVKFVAKATIDSREHLDQLIRVGGLAFIKNVLKWGEATAPTEDGLKVGNGIQTATAEEYDKLRQRLIAKRDEINAAQVALNLALESRKQKEKKAKDAENKLNDEKNKPHKGAKDYGHNYHPVPKTEEIKGLGELKDSDPKTPKQGGGGKRARWYGDKKRKIYEWDSQHGELEGDRASDGKHLGAFDPKTGKQIKGPDPKGRNIKDYL